MHNEIISTESHQPSVSCINCGSLNIVKDVPNAYVQTAEWQL